VEGGTHVGNLLAKCRVGWARVCIEGFESIAAKSCVVESKTEEEWGEGQDRRFVVGTPVGTVETP